MVSTLDVDEFLTTQLDRDALRVFQRQVSEQVLREKMTLLEHELRQCRRLVGCILGFVVVVILIITAAAVAVVVLQQQDASQACDKWLQNKQVGMYANYQLVRS